MQFVILAKDYTDAGAYDRRMAVRPQHFEVIRQMKAEGHLLVGGALLDDNEKMEGSVLIMSFASRAELEEKWLSNEPYIKGKVWETVEVLPYKIASLGEPLIQQVLQTL